MKTLIVIALTVLVAAIGWRLARPANGTNRADESHASHSIPPATTLTDPAQVFQQAFWKRPTASDRILNAERREWKDSHGISKWQWFIQVRPSPELVKHLVTNNAFNLSPSTTPPGIEKPPPWFAADTKESRILRAPGGGMALLFDEKTNMLFATDSGGGFRKGAPEPAKPVAQNTAVTSRLPNSPPPKP